MHQGHHCQWNARESRPYNVLPEAQASQNGGLWWATRLACFQVVTSGLMLRRLTNRALTERHRLYRQSFGAIEDQCSGHRRIQYINTAESSPQVCASSTSSPAWSHQALAMSTSSPAWSHQALAMSTRWVPYQITLTWPIGLGVGVLEFLQGELAMAMRSQMVPLG